MLIAKNDKYYESEYEEAMVMLLQQEVRKYAFGEDLHKKTDDALYEDDLNTFVSIQSLPV
ncbi:MAG: hypothetical protein K6G31_06895 [Paludibacteraceae bacterium]|nr:hypothetical protein [Paludibacteraceae bacterium]